MTDYPIINGQFTCPQPAALAVEAIAVALARCVDASEAVSHSANNAPFPVPEMFDLIHMHLSAARVQLEEALGKQTAVEVEAGRDVFGTGEAMP